MKPINENHVLIPLSKLADVLHVSYAHASNGEPYFYVFVDTTSSPEYTENEKFNQLQYEDALKDTGESIPSKEMFLKPLKDEVSFLNFLLSLGFEYIDTFYDNEYGYDRCLYISSEDINIPLTKDEYEDLRKAVIGDVEIEIYKLRKEKGL